MIPNLNTKSKAEPDESPLISTYIERRGVAHAGVVMGWIPSAWYDGTPGYDIPVQDAGGRRLRFRCADKKIILDGHKTKTAWKGKTGSYTPKYYHHPAIAQHIADANGKLIIASGEFDLLTLGQIGSWNVVSFTSENSIPHDLGAQLLAWGVNHVEYWPDNDEAGRLSGRKIIDALADTGITVNVYSLADHVGQGGDTNDLWQLSQFETVSFWAALKACPLADLPPSERKVQRYESYHYDHDDIPSDFIRDVIQVAERLPGAYSHQGGRELRFPSVTRTDNHPSVDLNIEKLQWIDRATGEGGNIITLGRHFGIDIWEYRVTAQPDVSRKWKHPTQEAESEAYWPNGVPDAVRSQLLLYAASSEAVFMEHINNALREGRLSRSETYTTDQIINAVPEMSEKTVRGHLPKSLFFSKMDSHNSSIWVSNPEKNSSGRPPTFWNFNSLTQVWAKLRPIAKPQIEQHCHPVTGDNAAMANVNEAMLRSVGVDPALAGQLNRLRYQVWRDNERPQKRAYARQHAALEFLDDAQYATQSTPLPVGWSISNRREYQAALRRAIHEADPDSRASQDEIAFRCGYKKRNSVPDLNTRAGSEGCNA